MLGGDTPLWDALTELLVEQREGSDDPADGVIVVRTASRSSGGTAQFLLGLYAGLGSAGVPAVGVEHTTRADRRSRLPRRHGLSTVDDVDTLPGGSRSVLLLARRAAGPYGVNDGGRRAPACRSTAAAGG